MSCLISFRTSKFDARSEPPNPINPIAGQSVLNWLRIELDRGQYVAADPAAEDWGWCIDVRSREASYMVGASADVDDSVSEVDWILQVHKHRSLKEKLLGRNKMAADDPLVTFIEALVRADPQFLDVTIDRGT